MNRRYFAGTQELNNVFFLCPTVCGAAQIVINNQMWPFLTVDHVISVNYFVFLFWVKRKYWYVDNESFLLIKIGLSL